MRLLLLLAALAACAHDAGPTVPAAGPVAPPTEPEPPAVDPAAPPAAPPSTGTDAPPASGTLPVLPRDPGFNMPLVGRIEGPSSPGECAADADCATAGCSHEVCVSAANAPHIITTCEMLPAFDELKACTCQAGVCQWVHEAGARGGPKPIPLPVPQ